MKAYLNRYKLISCGVILCSTTLLSSCIPALFAGVAKSTVELAKDRTSSETFSDARIASAIKLRFAQKGFSVLYTKIKLEVVKGRVLLTGSIEKSEYARNAVAICWEQKGVVEVIDELKVDVNSRNFDLAQYTRDSFITSQVRSNLFLYRDIKSVNYTIITDRDVVYIFGIARSQDELEQVARIAANVNGVSKVVSHVVVDEDAARRAQDRRENIDNSSKESGDIEIYEGDDA